MRRASHPWDRFYRRHEAPWRGERPLEPLRPYLEGGPDGPVLELGCGNGKLLGPLRSTGVDAVGLDVSWNALRRLPPATPKVLADAAVLPFRDGAFAAVLDIHCTGHLDAAGRRAALAESYRVLASGGHMVVERLGRDDLRASQGAPVPGDPVARRLQDGRTTHFTTEGALAEALVAAGFQVVDRGTVRRSPRLRGQRVMRESVWVAARKAGARPAAAGD